MRSTPNYKNMRPQSVASDKSPTNRDKGMPLRESKLLTTMLQPAAVDIATDGIVNDCSPCEPAWRYRWRATPYWVTLPLSAPRHSAGTSRLREPSATHVLVRRLPS